MKSDLEKRRERLQATHYFTLNLDGHISTSSLHLGARLASVWDESLGQAFPLSPALADTEQRHTNCVSDCCLLGIARLDLPSDKASVVTSGCIVHRLHCNTHSRVATAADPVHLLNMVPG